MKKISFYIKRLEIQVILALILGLIVWINFPDFVTYFSWMWDLFMRLLKVLLWPLLFFSVIVAILWLWNLKKLWWIWLKTFSYYMLTTTVAIWTGLTLINIFKPWANAEFSFEEWFNPEQVESLSFTSFLNWLIPDNIINSFIEFNAMQIVTMSILLWIAILATNNKSQINTLHTVFKWINDWILKFIEYVIKLTPFWVFAIIAVVVKDNWAQSLLNLLPFVSIILFALFFHACINLPTIWYFVGKFNVYEYFLQVKEAILVWFSTASSSATMGLSMSVAKNKAKLNEDVVNFTFPIGTTINMDWTALYQAWVAIFVAQIVWIDLSIIQQLVIVVIVILASVGAAWVPWAGILILTTVFLSIWLPVEAIWIVLAIDRVLDMFRTWVNVWWDLITAKVVDTYYKKELESIIDKVKH